jgi:carboxyl-terminal processing protease
VQESDKRQKERNAERRERFGKIAEEDRKMLSFFKVTLEDLDNQTGLKPFDPTDDSKDYMRRAKDETEDLDQTPKWPTGLDPVKREGLMIARDLVELSAQTVSVVPR